MAVTTNDKAAAQRTINTDSKLLEPLSLSAILEQVKHQTTPRLYPFSAAVLNDFWNQGLVAGSLTLLAGEPGLGKSTLGLQLLRALHQGHILTNNSSNIHSVDPIPKSNSSQPNSTVDVKSDQNQSLKLLYITAEESSFELARRSQRLGIPVEILALQSNNFEQIDKVLTSSQPEVVIIDSIQTIFSSQIPSAPGSITQVSTIASQLLAISKAQNIAIIIIGHVTKDGQIAGPKTLEHLVDSVLLLESSESAKYRTLAFSKHRFGSTTGMLLLKMEETGLEVVTDPSLALLENLETGVGVSYGIAMDRDLPLVVEIQALVAKPMMGGFGRREAIGIKNAKLNVILAVAEKYLDLDLKDRDIYIQIAGLPKNLSDESLDLPILLAILSSLRNKSLNQIIDGETTKSKIVFAGRLTFSGNLRAATELDKRTNIAAKLGFQFNPNVNLGDIRVSLNALMGKK